MTHAKVIWPPYPYEAGFCITDDPDASTFAQTRAVYDLLLLRSFVTTKAVWAFNPAEKCGIPAIPDSALRGVTLDDDRYLSYCKELYQQGVELCLHGASSGNNKRDRTRDALELFAADLGASDTYICHSKNAENIYWEDKITSLFPFHALLRRYSKHTCEGELEGSAYYWGDLCHARINQIRLYRTRCRNTLKRNPSMPYHDPRKPLVNGWFSATKRSMADCATEDAINRLKQEYGLTVLYQYLHRYADPGTGKLNGRFVQSVERISSDPKIFVRTVSSIMKRLRQMQAVYTIHQGKSLWIVNLSDEDTEHIQIVADRPLDVETGDNSMVTHGRLLVVKTLVKKSLKKVRVSDRIALFGRNALEAGRDKHVTCTLPFGKLQVNLSGNEWPVAEGGTIPPESFRVTTRESGTGIPLLSVLSDSEERGLIMDQSVSIAREVIFKGRSLNVDTYLDNSRAIPLEDHDNW